MAVFFFVQNLCQKCESILMDHLELKLIELDHHADQIEAANAKARADKEIKELDAEEADSFASNQKQKMPIAGEEKDDSWIFQNDWKVRIPNRLKRIYGSDHEHVAAFQKLIKPAEKNALGNLAADLTDINPLKGLASLNKKITTNFKDGTEEETGGGPEL